MTLCHNVIIFLYGSFVDLKSEIKKKKFFSFAMIEANDWMMITYYLILQRRQALKIKVLDDLI